MSRRLPSKDAPRQDIALFDAYSKQYALQLQKGLCVTGEDAAYYARMRVAWLARILGTMGFQAASVLDFGCGVGNSTEHFLNRLGAQRVVGLDPSVESLNIARSRNERRSATYVHPASYEPKEDFDLAFCNGVFHHIQPPDRPQALDVVARSLRKGGLFAFCENNPWNPGTRYIMSRVAFDKDAITITPPRARELLASHGFEPLRTDYLFVFPRLLAWLRPLEGYMCCLPLGGQYMILCKKGGPR
jgi:SAM-dependent methyltransferase